MHTRKKHLFDAFAVYFERRVLSLFFFGFSSGLPLLLVFSTLSAWLFEEGISKTSIGWISLVGSAYALKFLWSPLVDKMPIPFLSSALGQRRSWLLLSQIIVVLALWGLAFSDPSILLKQTVLFAIIVAFASATQDIAVDAYRTEILSESRLGAGAAILVFGYRIALLASTTAAFWLADIKSWSFAYLVMGALGFVGIATTLFNPEPEGTGNRKTKGKNIISRAQSWIIDAVISPFAEFMSRRGWIIILLSVLVYKYSDALLGIMANPFYLDSGFTKTDIGLVSGGWGLVMTLIGTALGGILVRYYSVLKALLFAGILQGASNLLYIWLALQPGDMTVFTLVIAGENLAGGMGTTAFVAYLSFLCNRSYTATQYALLSSLFAFTRNLLAAGGGVLADQVAWTSFFILSSLAALPGLILIVVIMRYGFCQFEKE